MKNNAGLMMALMASAMASGQSSMMFTGRGDDAFMLSDGDLIPLGVKPPNGCKEYFFKECGQFSNGGENEEHFLKTETVFKCFAINSKNAIKKFSKWKSANTCH